MRRHRLGGPYRAGLLGGMITNRKDEVEWRCTGRREFVPALAAKALDRQMVPDQCRDSQWMHRTARVTAGAECLDPPPAEMIQQPLRHDAARRVAAAEKQDVECVIRCHGRDLILTT